MRNYEHLDIQYSDRVATVTIQHPPVNALSPAVVNELGQAFGELASNTEVGAVVITGAGPKIFVAGADIKAMSSMDPAGAEQLARDGQAAIDQLASMPKLTICAINGLALGGGLELAMACDLRFAVDHAKVGQPEINLGIIPGFGGTQRLPRIVGVGRAMEMLISGDPISAEQAKAYGLVNEVYSADELMPAALKLAKRVATQAPVAVKLIKQAVYAGLDTTLAAGLDHEAKAFHEVFTTEDKDEGIQAFMGKRAANFKGQ